MKTSYIFLAPGFEEIEAVTPIDVLRRAGMPVKTVAVAADGLVVAGAHGVPYVADMTIGELPSDLEAEWLVLPGGMPGATNLVGSAELVSLLTTFPGNIAAICASPSVVLGSLGLLEGKRATCYPSMESFSREGVTFTGARVERDGRFITGRGPAMALDFAAAIVEASCGPEKIHEVLSGMLVQQ